MEKVLLIVIFTLELSKYLMGNKLVFHHGNPVRGMVCNGFVLMILYTVFTALVPQSVLLDMVVVHGIIGLIVWFAIRRSDVQGKILNLICLGVIAYCINNFPIFSVPKTKGVVSLVSVIPISVLFY